MQRINGTYRNFIPSICSPHFALVWGIATGWVQARQNVLTLSTVGEPSGYTERVIASNGLRYAESFIAARSRALALYGRAACDPTSFLFTLFNRRYRTLRVAAPVLTMADSRHTMRLTVLVPRGKRAAKDRWLLK
jgi:hypothetical protein